MPKKGAPPPPQKPEGAGKKRTPTSAYDPAAGKDVYEPEKIIGQGLSKGITQFNVKWVGWADKDNTWEPIEHLAGCEDMIAGFMPLARSEVFTSNSFFLPSPERRSTFDMMILWSGGVYAPRIAMFQRSWYSLSSVSERARLRLHSQRACALWMASRWYLSAPASSAGVERVFSAAGIRATCMVTCRSRPRTPRLNTPSLPRSTLTELVLGNGVGSEGTSGSN